MDYNTLKFGVGFESAVSILSAEGYCLPQFINPDWKENEYAIFKRIVDREVIGYIWMGEKHSGCYVEFKDNCNSAERSKIQKALGKGWGYWKERDENALKKRKFKNLEVVPKEGRVKGKQCQEIRE